jgi:hypothetical protein
MIRTGKSHAGRVNLTKYVKVWAMRLRRGDSVLSCTPAMAEFGQTTS